ncbi:MAG: HigA family addiction module antitoxin [Nitrospirae bacterium YQR-1]
MKMHNPPHPGEVLNELSLKPLGISITEAAGRLNVTRKTVSKIINGHSTITPEMALRLEIVFGSTAQTWLNIQNTFDLWRINDKRKDLNITLHPVL